MESATVQRRRTSELFISSDTSRNYCDDLAACCPTVQWKTCGTTVIFLPYCPARMSRPLAPDSPGNAIVADEERLLANVTARASTVSEDGTPLLDYDREMIDLR